MLYIDRQCLQGLPMLLQISFFIITKIHEYIHIFIPQWASLVAQMVNNLPAVNETQVWSLGWEDLLEDEAAPHSSTLARESHGQKRLTGNSTWGHKESDMTEQLTHSYSTMRLCLMPVKMAIMKKSREQVLERMRKKSHYGKQYGGFFKNYKNRTTL